MAVAFGWQRKGALAVRGVSLGGRGVRFSFAGRILRGAGAGPLSARNPRKAPRTQELRLASSVLFRGGAFLSAKAEACFSGRARGRWGGNGDSRSERMTLGPHFILQKRIIRRRGPRFLKDGIASCLGRQNRRNFRWSRSHFPRLP